ncbi:type II toxin-antitoxin system HicB family antitoxin [Clostridium sp. WILCCON 0269]|uniref:Type II toxin-antitoxin system HicB family antitoxin n=1 Tax=Candidatus Clostridium eludens TaxID=3381663 RepID=A0ABW8SEL0_9CLOT
MKRVNLQFLFTPCKKGYVALCPNLDGCYTQGTTKEEAYKMLMELVRSAITKLSKDNEELDFFIEANSTPAELENVEVNIDDVITRTN